MLAALSLVGASTNYDSEVSGVNQRLRVVADTASHCMNTSQDDDEHVIHIRKGALKSICDAVERAHSATRHAVQLASSARDQFEQEERVLADTVRKLQRLVDGS